MQIHIWSDLVCPWCYVGKRRFERALAAFPRRDEVEIVHRSFQLDPTVPKGKVHEHRKVLMSKYGMSEAQAAGRQAQMERTASAEGLEFHMSGVEVGNTFDAHRLVHLARDRGVQDAVVERFFRAHFTEKRSLFDPTSLVELAADAGLDAAEAREVLASSRYAEDVATDLGEARELGVNGVPFFVIDQRFGVSGAQPSEVFSEALARASQDDGDITRTALP